ncbi:MAG: two pore domain potassium channel family protein [Gammaproteobacteria bacterium]|nr:two pore domain potassium channel family protein [Gammaproteobacteria bacterium]
MVANVLLGLGAMVVCLAIQAFLVVVSIQVYVNHRRLAASPTLVGTFVLICGVMLVLVVGNFLQIALWAGLFMYLGEFADFNTAAYYSAVNFSTLGYGDIVMSEQYRVLGPMQAVNGVLMIGVSTAVVMAALQNALKMTLAARQREEKG